MRLVLLTGNPGDGKTSFLVQVGERFAPRVPSCSPTTKQAGDSAQRPCLRGGLRRQRIARGQDIRRPRAGRADPGPGEDPQRRTVLLAINDGRLLQFFTDHEDHYEDEAAEVHRQMDGKPVADPTIALVDLKRRTLAPRLVAQPGGTDPGQLHRRGPVESLCRLPVQGHLPDVPQRGSTAWTGAGGGR